MADHELVSIHEAGHAVIAMAGGTPVVEMAVRPCANPDCKNPGCMEGFTRYGDAGLPVTVEYAQYHIVVCAAGAAAGVIGVGARGTDGDAADNEQANEVALLLVRHVGVRGAVEALTAAPRRAAAVLQHPDVWRLADKLAAALRTHGRLDAADVNRLTCGHPGLDAARAALRDAMRQIK